MAMNLTHDVFDLMGEAAAVGVTQNEMGGSRQDCGLDGAHRILRVGLETVEEMLQVHQDPPIVFGEETHRIGDHRHPFVEGGLKRFEHLVLRAFRHDAHRRRPGIHEMSKGGVLVDFAPGAPRRPERHEGGHRQIQLGDGAMEELDVFRVGPRPPSM
jgi:hypothetical protein